MCLVGRAVVKRELLFISFDLFSFSQMFPLFLLLQLGARCAASRHHRHQHSPLFLWVPALSLSQKNRRRSAKFAFLISTGAINALLVIGNWIRPGENGRKKVAPALKVNIGFTCNQMLYFNSAQ
jgi:hypothetical protein